MMGEPRARPMSGPAPLMAMWGQTFIHSSQRVQRVLNVNSSTAPGGLRYFLVPTFSLASSFTRSVAEWKTSLKNCLLSTSGSSGRGLSARNNPLRRFNMGKRLQETGYRKQATGNYFLSPPPVPCLLFPVFCYLGPKFLPLGTKMLPSPLTPNSNSIMSFVGL